MVFRRSGDRTKHVRNKHISLNRAGDVRPSARESLEEGEGGGGGMDDELMQHGANSDLLASMLNDQQQRWRTVLLEVGKRLSREGEGTRLSHAEERELLGIPVRVIKSGDARAVWGYVKEWDELEISDVRMRASLSHPAMFFTFLWDVFLRSGRVGRLGEAAQAAGPRLAVVDLEAHHQDDITLELLELFSFAVPGGRDEMQRYEQLYLRPAPPSAARSMLAGGVSRSGEGGGVSAANPLSRAGQTLAALAVGFSNANAQRLVKEHCAALQEEGVSLDPGQVLQAAGRGTSDGRASFRITHGEVRSRLGLRTVRCPAT